MGLSEVQVGLRWFMQLPTHRQIRLCIRIGFNDYSSLVGYAENNKKFFTWIKETDKLDEFLEISKDPDAKDDVIKVRVRERKLNRLIDEGDIQK